ncbi:MAG: PAN domain-containing protein, partial [Pseudolabrys sp.]
MQISIRTWTALALALALADQADAQSGFDRRGGDYLNFQVRNGDPAVCAARCERDARCHAWA